MEDLLGTLLDHFQILELLGRGGMGAVYKARDLSLQRDVAVKVMHPHIAEQGDFKERFLQEARSAARLDHPGIVRVFHFGQAQSLLYIVMQYIPGANLRDMLEDLKERGAWVPLDEAVQLVRQISAALDYAHRRGVLHRDIKPKNIMIDPEPSGGLPYRPVITDLGLAKLADSDFVTRPGSSMGTPAYMSPEQALGKPTDARSDVYSLGILLYELAVGRVPFPAKTITEAIRYHTTETPPAPRTLRADLPQSLEQIILKALEKEPAQRYARVAELAQALAGVTAEVTDVARMPTALGDAISLMTQYQDSLMKPRGPSLLVEFDTPIDVRQDSVQLLVDGEMTATVALAGRTTKIGRQEDNDLVLDDRKASRHHAQVDFDGADYRVMDLGSSNGTYLANAKLLPGVSEIWMPDKALRIGDTVLRLVLVDDRVGTGPSARPGTVVAGARDMRTSSGQGWVGMLMDTTQLSVEPGATTVATFIVLNQGPLVDHFEITVEGVPSGWVSVSPTSIHLLPGQEQKASVMLRPPRIPESRAGQHPLSIHVTSQSDPSQTVMTEAVLTVAAYYQLELSLRPGRQYGIAEGDFAMTVTNRCNADLTVRPEAVDIEDGCRYAFVPSKAIVAAGHAQEIALKVRPEAPLRGDSARTYAFTVTARVDEAPGVPEQTRGIWVQTPPVYDMGLRPESLESTSAGEFTVHLVNLGEADLTLELGAMDAERGCRFDFDSPQVVLPVGQERDVALTVLSRAPLPSTEPMPRLFTVTAKPVAVPGFIRQVQGTWVHLAPPPAPAKRAVTPSRLAPASQPVATAPSQRRWFWGCVVLLLGLALTAVTFFLVGRFIFEGLDLPNEVAWAGAVIASLVGLVVTLRVSYKVWHRQIASTATGASAGPSASPSAAATKPRWFWGLAVAGGGLGLTFAAGVVGAGIADDMSDLTDSGTWVVAGLIWLVGAIFAIRAGLRVARRGR